jgi:hypothetical protein
MALSPDLLRSWREWQRSLPAFDRVRASRAITSLSGVEHDLDHLASYIAWLFRALLNGEEFDFSRLANDQIQTLGSITEQLDIEVDSVRAAELREFISGTEKLLRLLVREDVTSL